MPSPLSSMMRNDLPRPRMPYCPRLLMISRTLINSASAVNGFKSRVSTAAAGSLASTNDQLQAHNAVATETMRSPFQQTAPFVRSQANQHKRVNENTRQTKRQHRVTADSASTHNTQVRLRIFIVHDSVPHTHRFCSRAARRLSGAAIAVLLCVMAYTFNSVPKSVLPAATHTRQINNRPGPSEFHSSTAETQLPTTTTRVHISIHAKAE